MRIECYKDGDWWSSMLPFFPDSAGSSQAA